MQKQTSQQSRRHCARRLVDGWHKTHGQNDFQAVFYSV
jgi:hypothetical protein